MKKFVIRIGDLKPEKLKELKEFAGNFWGDNLLEVELADIPHPSGIVKDALMEAVNELTKRIDDGTGINSLVEKEFLNMTPDRQNDIRKMMKERGHDCSTCDRVKCVIHPHYDPGRGSWADTVPEDIAH